MCIVGLVIKVPIAVPPTWRYWSSLNLKLFNLRNILSSNIKICIPVLGGGSKEWLGTGSTALLVGDDGVQTKQLYLSEYHCVTTTHT